ncbi:OstA-like protein [Christiangramia sabulilitoris]|uniref:OstA-like protein n=1 Tax=Christiangramia sabulilitoris TaxID=2583991 RepID=A0A550I7F1_9FLAO|nr:OstA-like protein [Christiangramia sabulilitoris]TRO66899.1 OstA-like protein [Christiangramia sabulilitoris]
MKTYFFFLLIILISIPALAQKNQEINYDSDRTLKNEERYPGALILSGIENQVYFDHDGIEVWCDNAVFYKKANFFKAYGNIRMQQGDSVSMTSKYAEYNGNTEFAFASGNVKMKRPQTTLETDSLFFDRLKQQAYYRSGGKVTDTASVLTSTEGRYFMEENKYSFKYNVVVTNPEYTINSEQLDFYSESGHAYLYGPSTIKSETSTVYCERGFYDTRADNGYFVKNSQINYDNRILKGDSLYFNRERKFASATNNIKVIDTINNSRITGHYAEVYREKDSVFITKRALAASLQERDTLFIHSDTIMVTGKPEKRVIRGYYNVRMFKEDQSGQNPMSGKSDSIYSDQQSGLTKLINLSSKGSTKPVLWSGLNQMSGDSIHLHSNTNTEQLDSLRVFNNAFLIQKDSIEGYNQLKGKELTGFFTDNALERVVIDKNTETLNYMRNDDQELIGINKTLASSVEIFFEDQQMTDIYYYRQVDGKLTPEEEFPPNARRLQGFNWRGEERILDKEGLFAGEEDPELTKIQGIALPDEPEEFFEERDEDDLLLDKNSRLNPKVLKNRKIDSLKFKSRKSSDSLKINPNKADTLKIQTDKVQ